MTATCAFAQPSSLGGRVLDSTRAVLPGVTVEAKPAAGGAARIAVTGEDGTYAIVLSPGTYDVSFRLLNFATILRRGVVVDSSVARLDVTLDLASNAEVVVTARQTVFAPTTTVFGVTSGEPRNSGRAAASILSPKLTIVFGP